MALWEDLGLYSTKVTRKQSTSFKTRFLAKSPGANGLKAFCCDCLITDKILECECECGTHHLTIQVLMRLSWMPQEAAKVAAALQKL